MCGIAGLYNYGTDSRPGLEKSASAMADVRALWVDHMAGKGNHQTRLWTVLCFQAWLREWEK
jgi:hypothetical protein